MSRSATEVLPALTRQGSGAADLPQPAARRGRGPTTPQAHARHQRPTHGRGGPGTERADTDVVSAHPGAGLWVVGWQVGAIELEPELGHTLEIHAVAAQPGPGPEGNVSGLTTGQHHPGDDAIWRAREPPQCGHRSRREDYRSGHHQKVTVAVGKVLGELDGAGLSVHTGRHRALRCGGPVVGDHQGLHSPSRFPQHESIVGHCPTRRCEHAPGWRSYTRGVDIATDNPVGRVPDTRTTRRAHLRLTGSGWQLGHRRGSWSQDSVERLLTRLDTLHAVHWNGTVLPAQAQEFARFVHRAVARGTQVSGAMDARIVRFLPPDLAARISPAPHHGSVGELAWDVAAVEQRRAALAALLPAPPPISVVLVSRRPDLIVPIVRRIAAQNYPELEIVVGAHGVPLPTGLAQAAGSRPLVARELDAGLVFGDALNEAFSFASGALVNKSDDDDFISDDHIWDLAAAHVYSQATLVGKTTTVVHLEALDTTVRRVFGARETFTHRVAGSTMTMTAADLKLVGGWPSVPRAVDTALLTSIQRHGGTVYQPHDIGYLYVRGYDPRAHTWAANTSHFLRNVREQWVGLLRHPAFGTTSTVDGAPIR